MLPPTPRLGTSEECLLSPLLFIIVLKVQTMHQGKKRKDMQIGKELKLSLFVDDMIVFAEIPRNSCA